MAFRQRFSCYTCNRQFQGQQMRLMNGDEHIIRRQIAITRREGLNFPPLPINDITKLCFNCFIAISNEIELIQQDPNCTRLNVVHQTSSNSCIICNAENDVHRLSVDCRVNVFVIRNIYIPENVRSCAEHLDENGLFLADLLPDLRFINRPYIFKGQVLELFLQGLRIASDQNKDRFSSENNFTDQEFYCIAPITKEQFNDLHNQCGRVAKYGHNREISKKDLLTFLCKMRQGLTDDFLKILFNYPTRQKVSLVIECVRMSLMQTFVPDNIGLGSINREDFIAAHVTEFSQHLYNAEPEEPKAIVAIDATYAYIQKSSNFRVLRQSYSMHKNQHLVKPTMVVAPDGHILTILGPHFADPRNNDARILETDLEKDAESLRDWFRNGDIVLVDRGYRDVEPILERLGIQVQMPSFLRRGERQLSTADANQSRIVTKSRWIVEMRNGHIKSIFKFLGKPIGFHHLKNLNSFYCIAGALINCYHPTIEMQDANADLARQILQRAQVPNATQNRVETDNLRARNGQWRKLHQGQVADFPVLSMEYLKEIMVGTYQISLAPSYIQDKVQRDNDYEFQLDESLNDPGFIRIRMYSRFRTHVKHQIFIEYEVRELDEDQNEQPITGYYCTCQTGARTIGSCSHVASILWFLGFARHQEQVKYPDESLLDIILDAAGRRPPGQVQEEEEVVEEE